MGGTTKKVRVTYSSCLKYSTQHPNDTITAEPASSCKKTETGAQADFLCEARASEPDFEDLYEVGFIGSQFRGWALS